MADKVIYAMYDDDDVLKDGAKKLVSKGIKINEVFKITKARLTSNIHWPILYHEVIHTYGS